jgi:hypothetical protein
MKRHASRYVGLINRLGVVLCRLMHSHITRPVQGHYVCLECMRRHSVNF